MPAVPAFLAVFLEAVFVAVLVAGRAAVFVAMGVLCPPRTIAQNRGTGRNAPTTPMKAIFGLLTLVVVLAIVANLAQKNLKGSGATGGLVQRHDDAVREAARQSGGADAGSRLDAFPGAAAADPNAITTPQVSRDLQQRAVDRTSQALQQGVQRNERAAP